VTVLSFAGFEIVRRVPLLRPLFGLGPRIRITAPAAQEITAPHPVAGRGV
jgi:hypothetical protein